MYFSSITSEKHKLIKDLGNIFFLGGVFALIVGAAIPAGILFFIDFFAKKLGHMDTWETFLPFAFVFWGILLRYYFDVKVYVLFLPSWLTFSIIYLLNNFGLGGDHHAAWTWPSVIYTMVGCVIIWIQKGLKKDNKTQQEVKSQLPVGKVKNNKVLLIKGANREMTPHILDTIVEEYLGDLEKRYMLEPIRISEEDLILTFPYDIDFLDFCYIISDVPSMLEDEVRITITGWSTIDQAYGVDKTDTSGSLAYFYYEEDEDTEDYGYILYCTTNKNIAFAIDTELLFIRQDYPKRKYVEPVYGIDN